MGFLVLQIDGFPFQKAGPAEALLLPTVFAALSSPKMWVLGIASRERRCPKAWALEASTEVPDRASPQNGEGG